MTKNRLKDYWSSTTSPTMVATESFRDEASDEPDFVERCSQSVEQFLGSHPKITVATALALGVAIGWLVKRD